MTVKKALKVWYDSVGFNEIECGRDLQESIMVAFRSLEAWELVKADMQKEYIKTYAPTRIGDISNVWADAISIVNRYISEVEDED